METVGLNSLFRLKLKWCLLPKDVEMSALANLLDLTIESLNFAYTCKLTTFTSVNYNYKFITYSR